SGFSGIGPDNYTTSLLRLYSLGLSYIIQNLRTNNIIKYSDDILKKIMNAVDESILVLSPDLKIIYANTFFFNWMNELGLPPLQIGDYFIKGNSKYQKVFKNIENYYKKAVKTKTPCNTLDIVAAKEKISHYSVKRIPILNENNKLDILLNVSRDITEEKTALDKLERAEVFLSNVFNGIQDGISVLDKDLNILKVNKVMEKWYKHSLPLAGKKCYMAYRGRKKPCADCPTLKTLKTGATCSKTIPYLDPNKNITGWLNTYSYPLRDAKTGKIEGVIEHLKDITKDKVSEKILLENEVKYRELWNNAPVAYHTLNPDGIITSVNETELKMLGYDKEDMVGKPIFDFIEASQREEAQLRFLRKIAGKETAKSGNRIYLRSDGTRIVVSLDDVLEFNEKHEVTAVRTTMVDVTRQRHIEDELKNSLSKLKKTMDDAMRVITRLVEMRDPYTAGHQIRVAQLACAIARELGLKEDALERIRIAGLLHDLGKINVPIEILSKPGKISKSEFNIIKIHPAIGYEILKEMDFPYPVAETVLQHHERIDGSGYPYGLTGRDIILEAKIIMVSDIVEAMSSHRPYRPSKGIKDALKELAKNKGKLYDLKVAKACLNVFNQKKFIFSDR
ncbi:MAG: HD domain-containing phosphohydrolase, partial [Candidatus Firestonebacteria bacterium]